MDSFYAESRWSADNTVTSCQRCSVKFGITVTRHHCRNCGLIFCNDCSEDRALVPPSNIVQRPPNWIKRNIVGHKISDEKKREPKRVCKLCASNLQSLQETLRQKMSRAYQKLEFEDNEIYLGLPQYKFLLQNEISNAVFMLRRFKKNLGENEIPKASIASIKGVVCLSVFKAGLLFSGYYGSGIVTLKLSDGKWSAPSAISVSGIGWGIQIGAEVTDVMLVLSSDDAVNQFKSTGLISMTSEMEISIGFFGRGLGVYNNNDVGYGISSGLYVGLTVEAGVIRSRNDVNMIYYGEDVPLKKLLSEEFKPPIGASELYRHLDALLKTRSQSSFSSFGSDTRSTISQSDLSQLSNSFQQASAPKPLKYPSLLGNSLPVTDSFDDFEDKSSIP